MKDKLTALVVEGRITVNDLRTIENAFATVAEQASRIAELQEELDTWIHTNAIDVMQRRIAELEKQAAIDKTLLALADARINRAMQELKGGA